MRGIAPRMGKGAGALGMVHFDAHSDTWDTYFGGYKYTHGTPFRRAVEEGLLDPSASSRSYPGSLYKRDDNDWAVEQGMRVITSRSISDLGVDKVIARGRRVVGDGPTYVASTSTASIRPTRRAPARPRSGGYTPPRRSACCVAWWLDLVGGDVVEVSPPRHERNTALVGVTMNVGDPLLLAESVASGRKDLASSRPHRPTHRRLSTRERSICTSPYQNLGRRQPRLPGTSFTKPILAHVLSVRDRLLDFLLSALPAPRGRRAPLVNDPQSLRFGSDRIFAGTPAT